MKSQIAISSWGGRRTLPYAFTEHGVLMLSSVLNSGLSIKVNIQIMRVYSKIRNMLITLNDLLKKFEQLETKLSMHDDQFLMIFEYLKQFEEAKTIVYDSNVTVNNGTLTISSTDDGIHAEKIYTQNGGSVTVNNSYEGVEGFNIIVNGGFLKVQSSNDGINATAGLVSGGTESNDGSQFIVNGGTVVSAASIGDAIDCNGNITITGGVIIANGPTSGMEEGCDFNGSFNMNGGLCIIAGSNSNMTKAMSSTSTQPNMFIKSSAVISSTTLLHIQDATGTDLLTFMPKNGGYYFLFSSPSLVQGASYSIYTGGTYAGGSISNGLYTGGTYTAGTLKKTLTLSTTSKVNTVTF